jgi:hypothetical protein
MHDMDRRRRKSESLILVKIYIGDHGHKRDCALMVLTVSSHRLCTHAPKQHGELLCVFLSLSRRLYEQQI